MVPSVSGSPAAMSLQRNPNHRGGRGLVITRADPTAQMAAETDVELGLNLAPESLSSAVCCPVHHRPRGSCPWAERGSGGDGLTGCAMLHLRTPRPQEGGLPPAAAGWPLELSSGEPRVLIGRKPAPPHCPDKEGQ